MMALVPSEWKQPGSRLVVQFSHAPLWHERILLWLLEDDWWVVVTPDGDQYPERLAGYVQNYPMSGRDRYPSAVLDSVHAFAEPVERTELLRLIAEARRGCMNEQQSQGWVVPAFQTGLDWDGGILVIPRAEGLLENVRRRVTRKLPPRIEMPLVDAAGRNAAPLAARAEAPPVTSEADLRAPPGEVWVLTDAAATSGPQRYGSQVVLPAGSLVRGNKAIANFGGQDFACTRMTVAVYSDVLSTHAAQLASMLPVAPRRGALEPDVLAENVDDDVRTLWTKFDPPGSGLWFKPWREACNESVQQHFTERVAVGTQHCLEVCVRMERSSGTPTRWLADFIKDKNVGTRDRNFFEMQTLVEVLEIAGTVDQVNLGGLWCLELAARRLAGLRRALEHGPANANWNVASLVAGRLDSSDLLGPERQAEVSREARIQLDIQNLQNRLNASSSTQAGGNMPSAGDAVEGLPVPEDSTPSGANLSRRARAKAKTKAGPGGVRG